MRPGRSGAGEPPAPSEAERARETLHVAILAFRWVALGWMAVVALTGGSVRQPLVAVAAIALTAAWTAWLTAARPARLAGERRAWVLAADLSLAVALTLASGVVVKAGTVAGNQPFFAGPTRSPRRCSGARAGACAPASPPASCSAARWSARTCSTASTWRAGPRRSGSTSPAGRSTT